jgi:hypothetical protein
VAKDEIQSKSPRRRSAQHPTLLAPKIHILVGTH